MYEVWSGTLHPTIPYHTVAWCADDVLCSGAEGFSTEEDQELLSRIEKQLKRRFVIGSQVSEHAIVQDFTRQVALLCVLELVPRWISSWVCSGCFVSATDNQSD